MIRNVLKQGSVELGLQIPDESVAVFEAFVQELKKWNRKINLTAILDDRDIVIKHLLDSLVFAETIASGESVLDIGSGGGFPAIPLKIFRPDTPVVSVDAVGKKITFQRHVSRLLSLQQFEAVHARVEELHISHAGQFDVIVSRAFSRLDLFVALAAPLLKTGGRIIAMKGPGVFGEYDGVTENLRRLGFEIGEIREYCLPMKRGERNLVTLRAVKPHE